MAWSEVHGYGPREAEVQWTQPPKGRAEAEVQWTQTPKGRAHYGKRTLGKLHPVMPEMSKEGVRKVVEPLILEYFENGDYDEVLQTRLQH